jgi:hypothetical protein
MDDPITGFKDAQKCRIDAIAVLTEPENEPNCLDLNVGFNSPIRFSFSQTAVYAGQPGLVQPLLRFEMG